MFLGFDAIGFAAIGEAPEDRAVGGGSSEGQLAWEVIIYAGTHEFITRLGDTPADQAFKGTLEKAFRFDRSVIGSDRIGKHIAIGLGEVRLSNREGDYDFLAIDHTPQGQRVTIRRGDRRRPYSEWQIMLVGYMVGPPENDEEFIAFRLRDAGHRLDVPASPHIYAGTGGAEGGEDLKDKRKPRGFGWVENATPAFVSTQYLIYQVSDGPIRAVTNVYVSGAALTFAADYADFAALGAAPLGLAQYATCLAAGLVRVGVANPNEVGAVTVDFQGDDTGGVFAETTADIGRRLMVSAASIVDPDDLVETSFDELNAAQPAAVGYYIPPGDDQTVATAVGRLMAGIGGWCGATRTGRFEVRRLEAPSGSSTGDYDRISLRDGVKTLQLPQDLSPPPWRIRVGWGRNWTVQTDLVGSVSAARRAYLEQEVRYAAAESEVIRADFPPGHELTESETYFRDEADALTEAERLLDLWGDSSRALYELPLVLPYTHDVGRCVNADYPRFDLDGGKLTRIVKIVEDDQEGTSLVVLA